MLVRMKISCELGLFSEIKNKFPRVCPGSTVTLFSRVAIGGFDKVIHVSRFRGNSHLLRIRGSDHGYTLDGLCREISKQAFNLEEEYERR